jgi:hypothetical protein
LEGIAAVEEALGASKRIKGAYADLGAEARNCIQGVVLGLTEFLHALNFRYVLCTQRRWRACGFKAIRAVSCNAREVRITKMGLEMVRFYSGCTAVALAEAVFLGLAEAIFLEVFLAFGSLLAAPSPPAVAPRSARYKDGIPPSRALLQQRSPPFSPLQPSCTTLSALVFTEMHEFSSVMLSYTPVASCSPNAFRIAGNAMSL